MSSDRPPTFAGLRRGRQAGGYKASSPNTNSDDRLHFGFGVAGTNGVMTLLLLRIYELEPTLRKSAFGRTRPVASFREQAA